MRKIIATLTVIYCLFFTAACPSKASLEKAKQSSEKVATYADAGVNLTRDLYRSNFIDTATKDKIADAFIALARAGIAFDAAVNNALAQYGPDGAPPEVVNGLFNTFNSTVVAQFVAVLDSLKLTSVSGNFAAVVETIKTAVLVVAAAFKKKSVVAAQIA